LGVSHRDPPRVVRFALAVKDWIANLPNVHDARPPITPCCHVASAPPGGHLVLHGHGLRPRTVRGVLTPDEAPTFHELLARRYRCTACGATSSVVPVDVLPRKHFGAVTIALAFALYGALRQSLDTVYRALNPTRVRGYGARGWDSVLRWLSVASTLFPDVRPSPSEWSSHRVAERAAMTLAALIPDESLPIPVRVARAVCHPP
jgi:hypothetical protein